MKKLKTIALLVLFLTISAYGQNVSKNMTDKFSEFIAKQKFIKENYYIGISNVEKRRFFTEKINSIATDFKMVSESENPTDKKYQEKIGIGLSKFSTVYNKLDTEDRERICTYIEEIMDIVQLESSNGQLNKFMYGFDPNELKKRN
ncbi:DUF4844 domain-containing protein [Tenacibaculum sp. 190524A05c]|uniref:DUF4844 domain-containing protein n=1 Tax=Tenacibaculum platacis TaxID=3137852 RepID=UPI0032B2DE7C